MEDITQYQFGFSIFCNKVCVCWGLFSSSLVNPKDWQEPILLEGGKILWGLLDQLLQRCATPGTRGIVFYLGQAKGPNGGGGG